jgi:hypothetical protein
MQSTYFGILQFQMFQVRKCYVYLIQSNLKFQHGYVSLTIPLREMVTCWILWSTKISVSDVIVSDTLDTEHLPIVFHILDHVKIRNLSEPNEKFTDWDRFQSLALN